MAIQELLEFGPTKVGESFDFLCISQKGIINRLTIRQLHQVAFSLWRIFTFKDGVTDAAPEN